MPAAAGHPSGMVTVIMDSVASCFGLFLFGGRGPCFLYH